ncbi:DUF3500 domain-containing protein [Streptomyces sp. LP11]|uniref:DUF3500 domain-containing protein n=1 Tax=Streptomyces pyxinicus TaxID=2970331 RepID=A0ABT2AWW6_9ACTN|nr:DUF3500 domain-containing protein [Streptomyces sp. LP11]MCS0600746.1 DUF3500 domain-containing protein [Streptomyces sp. LP11]
MTILNQDASPPGAGTPRLAALAHAFADTLSHAQRKDLFQTRTLRNAANWSNFPEYHLNRGRVGVRTGTLSSPQWTALNALLAMALCSSPGLGYDRIRQHLDADEYLHRHGGGDAYGRGNFFVAFLGTPTDTGIWQLQFGGHHLAVANTYADGRLIGATPAFRGIEPFRSFTRHGMPDQPERAEQQALSALLQSLDAPQAATAGLRGRHDDLLLGPHRDWRFPRRSEGIAARDLTAAQRDLLVAAIVRYVGDLPEADARRFLDRYRAELPDTHVGFTGSTLLTDPGDYVRIDGPSVWIEFSMHDGIVLTDPHPHAVWRDKHTDYGGLRS